MTDKIYTCTAPKDYKTSDCWNHTRCRECKYCKPKFTEKTKEKSEELKALEMLVNNVFK